MSFDSVQALILQAQPIAFMGGDNLVHGDSPYAVPIVCDFSQSGIPQVGYRWAPVQLFNKGIFKSIQTVFLDNSGNNAYAEVVVPGFNQTFALPPGYQGYFPVLCALQSSSPFYINTTGTGIVNVAFINSRIAPDTWAATITPSSQGTTVNVLARTAQKTMVDVSGSIATGGLLAADWQLLMAADPSRQFWQLQNIDTTNLEAIYWSYSNTGNPGAKGSYLLAAAGGANYPGGYASGTDSNAIYVAAATTGHIFSASYSD